MQKPAIVRGSKIHTTHPLRYWPMLLLVLAALHTPAFAAGNVVIDTPRSWQTVANDSELPTLGQDAAAREANTGKSYLIPALDIVGFDFLLNQINRRYSEDSADYKSDLSSIEDNLHSSWTVDDDAFKINQLGHPYQGSMYHTFARSAGLNYWESLGYSLAGSTFWEIAGEVTPPSKNDMIATGVGGTFLGESLFRMSNLVLERPGSMSPFWREISAAAISPATGFNRLAYGERFKSIFASNDPAYYSRLQFGVSNTVKSDGSQLDDLKHNDAQVDFSMNYGLPGKPGYSYTRPFDYFSFKATASSTNVFENVMTHGLLIGKSYEAGESYRGVWGLYGSYDYISPQTFRVSSTALSMGTTGQLWLTQNVALQGTALLGAGYAAVGALNSTDNRDYHYGVAPQGLLAMRAIFGNRASFDISGREYFVSNVDADNGGHDNIIRIDASFTMRVFDKHGISIKYLWNQRDATYSDLGGRTQTSGTLGIYYTYLGHDGFGAVNWR